MRMPTLFGKHSRRVACTLLVLFGCKRATAAGDPPPNFIVIMADDLGYGDIACYGGKVRTPHLDRLAREGLRFTDFHSNGAVCSPTRAAFLTGRYPQRSGIITALGENAAGLPANEKTVAACLRERGYRTALFGKWHLGYHPANGPLRHGFDEFRGHLHGAVDYFSKVDQYGRVDWWHNDRPVADPTYATDLITEDAVRFIEANRARAFFAFVAHSAIHFPWQAPDDGPHRRPAVRYPDVAPPFSKLGPHSGDVGGVVAAMIESLDRGIGKIIAALSSTGIAERTLVFFMSDNGGILGYRGGYTNISSNGSLRGAKGSVYEGGHRVPAIARWPGRIAPGSVTDITAMTMDLMPTFLGLAGLPVPAQSALRLDGTSLASVLFGSGEISARDVFWRLADDGPKAVRRGQWKLVLQRDTAAELYDLQRDPGETRNLLALEEQRGRGMRDALARWEAALARP